MKQQKQKVLVVDDQQINRMLLSKILDSRYTVLQAENGLEAFNVLERERESIQVILLDLVMPGRVHFFGKNQKFSLCQYSHNRCFPGKRKRFRTENS